MEPVLRPQPTFCPMSGGSFPNWSGTEVASGTWHPTHQHNRCLSRTTSSVTIFAFSVQYTAIKPKITKRKSPHGQKREGHNRGAKCL